MKRVVFFALALTMFSGIVSARGRFAKSRRFSCIKYALANKCLKKSKYSSKCSVNGRFLRSCCHKARTNKKR